MYYIKCKKYEKFKKAKISYICDKMLLLSSICNECWCEDQNILEEEESIVLLKILDFINNM